jgi:hypothetical protein
MLQATSAPAPARTALAGSFWEGCYAELVKAVFDTDAASEVIASGQGAEVNRRIADRFQPEVFSTFAEDGQRTVLLVFDLTDPSQIPVLIEPMYQRGKAKVTLTPCMILEDLEKGFEELASQMTSTEG